MIIEIKADGGRGKAGMSGGGGQGILRLDELLRRELPAKIAGNEMDAGEKVTAGERTVSNSKIRRLILAGAVSVNGRECRRPAFEIRGKTLVTVQFDEEKFFYEKQPDDILFEVSDKDILFEDENLIFVNKPAFFPVEQTITGNRRNLHDALVDYLWKRNSSLRNPPYVGIMHRLDRETSGVILFTKTRNANKAVQQRFAGHGFTKIYTAVCCPGRQWKIGQRFTVEKFMGRISGKSQAAKWGSVPENKGGVYSRTEFTVRGELLRGGKKYCVVECELFTGRTHQIRVHLSEEGFPLLGDELYGGEPADRIYLHARELKCNNAELQLNFDVKSPLPQEFIK